MNDRLIKGRKLANLELIILRIHFSPNQVNTPVVVVVVVQLGFSLRAFSFALQVFTNCTYRMYGCWLNFLKVPYSSPNLLCLLSANILRNRGSLRDQFKHWVKANIMQASSASLLFAAWQQLVLSPDMPWKGTQMGVLWRCQSISRQTHQLGKKSHHKKFLQKKNHSL